MGSCIFKIYLNVLLCIYTSLSAFRNPESGSSTTTPALHIENEWPNFKEYIVAVEEEEWDENNIREFPICAEAQEVSVLETLDFDIAISFPFLSIKSK